MTTAVSRRWPALRAIAPRRAYEAGWIAQVPRLLAVSNRTGRHRLAAPGRGTAGVANP
jgi:hypothetical protein